MNIDLYLEHEISKVPGWCTPDKASKLYDYATGNNAKIVVEIGVFGGSSFFPLAFAMSATKGQAFGIDPWNTESCLEEMENQANKSWWGSQDMEVIYKDFLTRIRQYNLHNNTVLHRKKSGDVVEKFAENSIDLLHIDGNHCEKLAYSDSVSYLPKVKIGGHIFFDDVNWMEKQGNLSTQKGLDHLLQFCKKVDTCGVDCVILRRES